MPRHIGGLTLYELHEIADKIGCHINTLRMYLRKGKLKGRKVGNRWLVSEEGLRDFFYPEGTSTDDDSFDLWVEDPTISTAADD